MLCSFLRRARTGLGGLAAKVWGSKVSGLGLERQGVLRLCTQTSGVCVYVYVYIHIHKCIYIHIITYVQCKYVCIQYVYMHM